MTGLRVDKTSLRQYMITYRIVLPLVAYLEGNIVAQNAEISRPKVMWSCLDRFTTR